jgi:hypothetical protein
MRQLQGQYEQAMRALEARDAARPKPMRPRTRDDGPLPNRSADEPSQHN